MEYIIFDTETTGLPKPEAASLAEQPKIIEYAAVKTDADFNIIDRIEFKCNPGEPLEAIITKITGLTDDDLKDEKPFSAYYNDLCKFHLGTEGLIAHNLEFDRTLLYFELERMGKTLMFPWGYKHLCTKELSVNVGAKNSKLETLYNHVFNKSLVQLIVQWVT